MACNAGAMQEVAAAFTHVAVCEVARGQSTGPLANIRAACNAGLQPLVTDTQCSTNQAAT